MSVKTELITYINSSSDIDEAVALGITHIIINDPQISIRSWEEFNEDPHFNHIQSLIHYSRSTHSKLIISVQCDLLFHHDKDPLINNFIAVIKQNPCDFIRVQDLGLLLKFKELLPQINLVFLSEMCNNNWMSIDEISKLAARQTLNMELPHDKIKHISQQVQTNFECVVQGQILIQYSTRRFMAGLNPDFENPEQKEQIHMLAQDEDYPGRRFTFLDNHHGHFMFAYFDRCLLPYSELLLNLNLKGWIIDCRGQNKDTLKMAIKLYHQALHKKNYAISELEALTSRPQKPGFFKANQTDRRRYNSNFMPSNSDYEKVGQILDAEKGRRITFECYKTIYLGDVIEVFHPKLDHCQITVEQLWDLSDKPIQHSTAGQLVQIPWQKGIQQHAILGRKNALSRNTQSVQF
jgi:putative protease